MNISPCHPVTLSPCHLSEVILQAGTDPLGPEVGSPEDDCGLLRACRGTITRNEGGVDFPADESNLTAVENIPCRNALSDRDRSGCAEFARKNEEILTDVQSLVQIKVTVAINHVEVGVFIVIKFLAEVAIRAPEPARCRDR